MLRFNKFFPSDVLTLVTDKRINFALPKEGEPFTEGQRQFLNTVLAGARCGVVNVRQVHGCRVILGTPQYLKRTAIGRADAVVTNIPRLPIAVRTADCLPVFIFDPKNKAIGVVHAGWKGTKKQVVPAAVKLMRKKFRSRAKDLKVAFGPSIKNCCYQVGKEFKRHFPKDVKMTPEGLCLDLPMVNRRQLVSLGVSAKNILDGGACTFCSGKFFSFRRDGEKAGRMLSVMMLKK